MRQSFRTIKFVQFIIVFMCCGMLANAQSKVSIVNVTTDFPQSRPTNVVQYSMQSSKTALLSQTVVPTPRTTSTRQNSRTKVTRTITSPSTTVNPTKPLLSEKVSSTRMIVTSSMRANMGTTTPIGPTTVSATIMIVTSSMRANTNTTITIGPTTGPMASKTTNLGLIVGISVGIAAFLAVVCLAVCLLRCRLRKCDGDRTDDCGNDFELDLEGAVEKGALSFDSKEPRSDSYEPLKVEGQPDDGAFYNDSTMDDEVEEESIVNKPKERRSKTLSIRPGLVKKLITTEGGVTKIADIVLNIESGCLEKDTEITLIRDDQNYAFQSLLNLGLVDTTPRVVEFLPDGLKFLKPAVLTIKCEKIDPDSELFVLHGSYNPDYQRTVWELVTYDLEENNTDGVVNMRINGFCFYSYILAKRGKIARILSHLNHSFTCRAYAFFRRASMDSIDISVVFISEFVDQKTEDKIKQLQIHKEEGYTKGEKGKLKRLHTDRSLEMSLHFPGLERNPSSFKIDQPELDKDGFVVEQFMVAPITSPAWGTVDIKEVHRSAENKLLWKLNIREIEEEIKATKVELTTARPEPEVVYRATVLTNAEISRMSSEIGIDWDPLAALMDIPYVKREEIRMNHAQYPDCTAKGQQIFALINESQNFDRHNLEKCVKELGRDDVKIEIQPEAENKAEPPPPPFKFRPYENITLKNTRLSPREMFRLSRGILRDWASFACLMDIDKPEIDNIRANNFYHDDRSRAEKVLSIINNKDDFSRTKLADCLQGLEKLELIEPITKGAWRQL